MALNLADLRKEYTQRGLHEDDASARPFEQFERWFTEAQQANFGEANAMTLATATADGQPEARIVLLKGVQDEACLFYTNYTSAKGQALAANPKAALLFFWAPLERQVRIEGRVEQAPAEVSDAYFASRPRGSQLGAWASPQSDVISGRERLNDGLAKVRERYHGQDEIDRPPHWGGYRVLPERIEFWQGRPSRLHDRLLYTRTADGTWRRDRLAP
ncbi:MAG: pyridoxamine 5'-phosphate oxidase [Rhodothermales bacterium]